MLVAATSWHNQGGKEAETNAFKSVSKAQWRLSLRTVNAPQLTLSLSGELARSLACVNLPSPGAGGAGGLWHLWSTGSAREPPRCRCSARLHLEWSCTPATPPLAGWSAFRKRGVRIRMQRNYRGNCTMTTALSPRCRTRRLLLSSWMIRPSASSSRVFVSDTKTLHAAAVRLHGFVVGEVPQLNKKLSFRSVSSHKTLTEHPALEMEINSDLWLLSSLSLRYESALQLCCRSNNYSSASVHHILVHRRQAISHCKKSIDESFYSSPETWQYSDSAVIKGQHGKLTRASSQTLAAF